MAESYQSAEPFIKYWGWPNHLPSVHRIFLWEVFPFKKCWRILPLSLLSVQRSPSPPPPPPPPLPLHLGRGKKRKANSSIHCKRIQYKCLVPIYVFPEIETVLPRYLQNIIIMFCLPVSAFMYLWMIYIFPGSVCLFCFMQIGRPILGIYKSLIDKWM